LTGKSVTFVEGDICDTDKLNYLFIRFQIDAVIHFAALKAVGESTKIPLSYYQNNVYGSVCLLEVMQQHNVHNFIFSSSATVYGEENEVPYVETMKLGTPSSPYGASKVMVERVLADYPTKDGSCERDYLHVMDLAQGHVAALDWLNRQSDFSGVEAFNLGTGNGVSVFTIVKTFEQVINKKVPFEVSPRRAGDLPAFWANASKANKELNWQADRSLTQMMTDTWRWQSNNPNGYLV